MLGKVNVHRHFVSR